jgi:hypothetical protein
MGKQWLTLAKGSLKVAPLDRRHREARVPMRHPSARKVLSNLRSEKDAVGSRSTTIGLVNFDAIRLDKICTNLGEGAIVSNQVQVSDQSKNRPDAF